MIDSGMELAFISSMVYWLHYTAGGQWSVRDPQNGGQFSLHGKPEFLLLDQGHTSNGAAGTAFVAVGLAGILALYLRNRQVKRTGHMRGFTSFIYYFWLTFTVLSLLLSFAALIYTFVITYQHDKQSININIASKLNNHPYPNYHAYPDLVWTPPNWFEAVLRLDLVSSSVRSDINLHLVVMKAWMWNLIPLVIIGIATTVLAFADMMVARREQIRALGDRRFDATRQKVGSPYS